MRWLALLVLVAACSDSGPDNNLQLEGTWSGTYTNSASTAPFQVVMELEQEGTQISGTLASDAGRTATIDGQVDEETFTATITYTDVCEGVAQTEASVEGGNLVGGYTSTDCVGTTTGTYSLSRQ